MAMGKRERVRTTELWIPTTDLPLASSPPSYRRLNEVPRLGDFDTFVERASIEEIVGLLCGAGSHD